MSTTPLVVPPRLEATPCSTPSTTTGTPTPATPLTLVPPTPTSLSRATSSRTSLPLSLRTRVRSSPPAPSAPPAPAVLAALARPTPSAPLALSPAPRLASCPTSRARTLLLPPLPPLPSAARPVLASLLKRLLYHVGISHSFEDSHFLRKIYEQNHSIASAIIAFGLLVHTCLSWG